MKIVQRFIMTASIALVAVASPGDLIDLSSADVFADSQSFPNRGPEKAFDNSFSGESWESAGSELTVETHWIYVDLGDLYTINRVDIDQRANLNQVQNYTLRVFSGVTAPDPNTDLGDWTVIGTMAGRGNTSGETGFFDEVWNFDAATWTDLDTSGNPVAGGGTASGILSGQQARFLLIEGTSDVSFNNRVGITEIAVYGTVVPEPTTLGLLAISGVIVAFLRRGKPKPICG